jgi:hypothetical protein
MFGRKAPLDVIKGFFLIDMDEDTPIDRIGDAGPFDFVEPWSRTTTRWDLPSASKR